jgi:ABC-2 type transport system permease protein
MNWEGMYTLFYKELKRFSKVALQTVMAPIVTALLYLLVFSHVLEAHIKVYENVSYSAFLIPGLIMMSVIQNAFANSSSSLIQSKVTGNIIFVLLTPLSYFEFYCAFLGASIVRGVTVGLGIFIVAIFFVSLPIYSLFWLLLFALFSSAVLGTLGIIAGILAEKFDHMAGFQNFVIMPLSFLSGVFYSIHSLPGFWQLLSKFNPFLYMIDGFRFGFFGISDVNPFFSLAVVTLFWLGLGGLTLALLRSGYKLRD